MTRTSPSVSGDQLATTQFSEPTANNEGHVRAQEQGASSSTSRHLPHTQTPPSHAADHQLRSGDPQNQHQSPPQPAVSHTDQVEPIVPEVIDSGEAASHLSPLGTLTSQLVPTTASSAQRPAGPTQQVRPVDPVTALPFTPVDLGVLTLLYRGDEGWFLQSFPGFLFFCSQELGQTPISSFHPGLSIKFSCPARNVAATFTHLYTRWAESNSTAYRTLESLCEIQDNQKNLKLAPMKALFEGREAQRAGIAIGEVKKRMLDIIRGPEPVADENTQTKWQAACLDGHPKIEDVWTYAIPIPWRHGEGNKNDRQVVVPNQWNENKLPPFLHACRYLRPLLVNTEHITSEVLPESIRHTNKQRYASFLLQVKLHARFVTQSNLELFREIHQPRPQNFIPLVKGRPVYKTGADALLSPSGRYSNPVSQQVTDGSTGDDLNARKRKTVHDRMVEQYEDNFPKRTKPSRRMPSPGPDKPTHAQLATPPIYHRSGRSSHRPKVTTAQGDGGSEDSALAIRLRPTIDDFLREQEDSAWFSPSGMTPEELEDRIEATAIASHHQSELDMVYFAQHSTVRWRTGNTDYLPRADERVLYNPEEYEARRG